MNPLDYLVNLVLSVVLIVGAYQFYFWCQRHPLSPPREFARAMDEAIPFRPHWVWIYSFLYYPAILAVNLAVQDHRQFAWTALSYLVLLGMQMAFFLLYPVATPAHWRLRNPRRTLSERLLALVQRFDAPTNSFPSMHTSVAMLTALHLDPVIGAVAIAFPLLIGASCVLTKQHYLVDVPAGAALGWAAFGLMRPFAA
jgi:membrane-associated phospholipid phosphatase